MKKKDVFITILLTLVLGALVVYLCTRGDTIASPALVYKVYLDGKNIGIIESEEEFLKLVDEKQNQIKDKYQIDKVYPPNGLKIEKTATYKNKINTPLEIYQILDQNGAFTIDGYVVTIKYQDDRKPLYIYTLDKSYFEDAFYNTVSAFVGIERLEDYKNNTQEEIKDEGSHIESIYWDEDITIKQARISVKENIFTSADDLSKYLLFGTTEKQKTYSVKDGDNINDIIEKNHLSIEEFLIANPSIPDKDILLSKGQEVSIGLINPLVTIVHEEEVVEKITNKYETEYKTDSSMYSGTSKVLQEGSNGVDRVTEKIQYKNGDINQLVISKSEEITPTVNKIVVRGTKSAPTVNYNYEPIIVGDEWLWPTIKPYVITSRFGWRWNRHHNGIDISGCGFGSPVYASVDGVVTEIETGCPNNGYYGNSCGRQWGNYVRISVEGGKYTLIYAHLRTDVKVKPGQKISRGMQVGTMGNSGSSTGTHLHYSILDASGSYINPCRILSC